MICRYEKATGDWSIEIAKCVTAVQAPSENVYLGLAIIQVNTSGGKHDTLNTGSYIYRTLSSTLYLVQNITQII